MSARFVLLAFLLISLSATTVSTMFPVRPISLFDFVLTKTLLPALYVLSSVFSLTNLATTKSSKDAKLKEACLKELGTLLARFVHNEITTCSQSKH